MHYLQPRDVSQALRREIGQGGEDAQDEDEKPVAADIAESGIVIEVHSISRDRSCRCLCLQG